MQFDAGVLNVDHRKFPSWLRKIGDVRPQNGPPGPPVAPQRSVRVEVSVHAISMFTSSPATVDLAHLERTDD